MLLGDALRTAADRAQGKPALVFGATALTYGELEEQSERIAGFLRRAGVGQHPAVGSPAWSACPTIVSARSSGLTSPCTTRRRFPTDDLKKFVAHHIASYKVPERIEIVAELPLNPVGKVDRHALQEQALPRER